MNAKLISLKKTNIFSHMFSFFICLNYLILLSDNLFKFAENYLIYVYVILIVAHAFKFIKFDAKNLLVLLLNVFFCIVSVFFNGGGLGSAICYIIIVGLLSVVSETQFKQIDFIIISVASALCLLILGVYSFIYVNLQIKSDVINPNTYAQFLLFSFFLTVCFFNLKFKNKLFENILFIITAIIVGVFIMNFKSRGALSALVVFSIMYFLPRKWFVKKTFCLIIIVGFILQIMIPYLYLLLYNNVKEFEFLGKDLFSRRIVWDSMIREFTSSPFNYLTGVGSDFNVIGYGKINTHNLAWHLAFCFSPAVLILYLLITLITIKRCEIKDDIQYKCVLAFTSSVIVMGLFEVVVFYVPILIFTVILFGVAFNRKVEEKKDAKNVSCN